MWASVIAWLKEPVNQGIVTTLVSTLALLLSVVSYIWPRSAQKEKRIGINPSTRGRSRDQWQNAWLSRKIAAAVGLIAICGIAYGLYMFFEPEVKVFTVCHGEKETECGIPHNIFLDCNQDTTAWANGVCRSHKDILLNEHGGNHCGYTTHQITCVMR